MQLWFVDLSVTEMTAPFQREWIISSRISSRISLGGECWVVLIEAWCEHVDRLLSLLYSNNKIVSSLNTNSVMETQQKEIL